MGRRLARARRRHRHRARPHDGARDHPRRPREPPLRRSRRPTGFAEYAAHVEPYTLAEGERITGVPAETIRDDRARLRARRPRDDLLDARHHRAPRGRRQRALADQPRACSAATSAAGARASTRCAGRTTCRAAATWAPSPTSCRASRTSSATPRPARASRPPGAAQIVPRYGWNLTQMFEGMKRGELRSLYVIGENPAQSEADIKHTRELLAGLDFLVVQDILLTKTAELADVVLPSSASWCESEGTVTNSERRVQRVRKALDPPGEARDDGWIISAIAERMGFGWGQPSAEAVWDELRSLSPMHARHELREARGRSAASSGRAPTRRARARRSCTRASGPSRSRASPRRSRAVAHQPALRGARRRVPDAAHHRPPARVVQHGRADEPLPLAAAPRRVARPLARGRRAAAAGGGRGRARVLAARLRRDAGAHRPRRCGPA